MLREPLRWWESSTSLCLFCACNKINLQKASSQKWMCTLTLKARLSRITVRLISLMDPFRWISPVHWMKTPTIWARKASTINQWVYLSISTFLHQSLLRGLQSHRTSIPEEPTSRTGFWNLSSQTRTSNRRETTCPTKWTIPLMWSLQPRTSTKRPTCRWLKNTLELLMAHTPSKSLRQRLVIRDAEFLKAEICSVNTIRAYLHPSSLQLELTRSARRQTAMDSTLALSSARISERLPTTWGARVDQRFEMALLGSKLESLIRWPNPTRPSETRVSWLWHSMLTQTSTIQTSDLTTWAALNRSLAKRTFHKRLSHLNQTSSAIRRRKCPSPSAQLTSTEASPRTATSSFNQLASKSVSRKTRT